MQKSQQSPGMIWSVFIKNNYKTENIDKTICTF
jgi:hypothetical protein